MRSPNVETSHDNWRAKLFNVKALYREGATQREGALLPRKKESCCRGGCRYEAGQETPCANTLKAVY